MEEIWNLLKHHKLYIYIYMSYFRNPLKEENPVIERDSKYIGYKDYARMFIRAADRFNKYSCGNKDFKGIPNKERILCKQDIRKINEVTNTPLTSLIAKNACIQTFEKTKNWFTKRYKVVDSFCITDLLVKKRDDDGNEKYYITPDKNMVDKLKEQYVPKIFTELEWRDINYEFRDNNSEDDDTDKSEDDTNNLEIIADNDKPTVDEEFKDNEEFKYSNDDDDDGYDEDFKDPDEYDYKPYIPNNDKKINPSQKEDTITKKEGNYFPPFSKDSYSFKPKKSHTIMTEAEIIKDFKKKALNPLSGDTMFLHPRSISKKTRNSIPAEETLNPNPTIIDKILGRKSEIDRIVEKDAKQKEKELERIREKELERIREEGNQNRGFFSRLFRRNGGKRKTNRRRKTNRKKRTNRKTNKRI